MPTGPERDPTDNTVQITRARMGLGVVIAGNVAIAAVAILGLALMSRQSDSAATIVSILSSAFTAIATMTTAYFGIRAASNTAQSSIKKQPDGAGKASKQEG